MKRTAVAFAIAAIFLTPFAAQAGFTVDEGAPRQTALNAMQIAPQPAKTQDISMDIALVPGRSWVALGGKSALKEALDEIKAADAIRITTYAMRPANPAVQRMRAANIRAWLTANGVPASKIASVDQMDYYRDDPSGNTATLTLTQRAPARPQYAAQYAAEPAQPIRPATYSYTPDHPIQQQVAYQQPQFRTQDPDAKSGQVINDKVKLTLVQKIVAMAQNKTVKPEDAVTMLAEILKMQEGASAAPALSPATANVVAVDLPRTWTLDNKKTLRQNVEEWARIAKWEAPDWRSTTTFDFPYAQLNGTFLDVLGQLAKAVPALDFNANRSARSLTVVDAMH